MRKFITTILISILLLAGCGREGVPDSASYVLHDAVALDESDHSPFTKLLDYKIITDVTKDHILVGDVYYEITKNTKVVNSNNATISIQELQPGSLIKLHSSEQIDDTSYPGHSVAKIVKLQIDQESIQVSQAIRHFIENREGGLMTGAWINGIGKEWLHLRFYDTVEEKQYEAAINHITNESSVKEISSVAKEKEKGGNGTTTGFITEIYDNGFRINMADYTLTKDTVLAQASGETVLKESLQIGDFVRVDYSEFKGDGIIKEGKLNKLILLTSEEKPGVQEWVKSVMEGPLYKDPVIMLNYITRSGESYTIRVADLQDDTWDTFQVTYDFATKKQSIERIEHIPPSDEPTPYDDIHDYQIVQGVGEDRVFMGNKFEYLDEEKLETIDGEKISIQDLKVGCLIKFEYTPIDIERSVLEKIVWRNDELYENISASIRHFIENQQMEAIHSIYIYSINDHQIVLKFRVGQQEMQYEAVIERQTNQFVVEEAPVK